MVAGPAARLVLLAGVMAATALPTPVSPQSGDEPRFPAARAKPGNAFSLEDLMPGTDRTTLEMRVGEAGWSAAPFGRRAILVAGAIVPDLYADQRTLLELDHRDRLHAAHVLIEPPEGSSGAALMRLYADLKSALLRRLGPASWERASGNASPRNLLTALSGGHVIRYLQWGGPPCIRAGVPLRADGRVVLQILITTKRLDRGRTLWGRDDF